MPKKSRPVLSVIVRRFPAEPRDEIDRAINAIHAAVADQPGFLGLQHSSRPTADGFDFVTIVSFDSPQRLAQWENSPVRSRMVDDLDSFSQSDPAGAHVEDFDAVLHPVARVSRIEIVTILIFWIMVLGYILDLAADAVMPGTVAPALRSFIVVTINVLLISYVFLPFSSLRLTRFKAWLARLRKR